MKGVVIRVTNELLREVLNLPEEAVIADARVPFDGGAFVEFKVVGAGYELHEGDRFPVAPIDDFSVLWESIADD